MGGFIGVGGGGKPLEEDEQDITDIQDFEAFWEEIDADGNGRVTLHELASHYGVLHLIPDTGEAQARSGAPPSHRDPQYLEKRLDELHEREFGRAEKRPGGALLFFIIWDVVAFIAAVALVVPFLYREVIEGEINSLEEALADWRIRCGLYFLKVVIALLAFPFLVFAMPLMQIWLTHVKPTGYDQAGNCVPSLSSSQIKAKFRSQYIEEQKAKAKGWTPHWYEGCWDRCLGVDPEAELSIEDGILSKPLKRRTGKLSVVEAARQRRMQQARRERLPEASLLMAERAQEGPPLEGKLQVRGDPGSLLML